MNDLTKIQINITDPNINETDIKNIFVQKPNESKEFKTLIGQICSKNYLEVA